MINFGIPKHHWNYFLAIENDLKNIARYIEFSDSNMNTYSIELTHILLSASSEIDVILKQLCNLLEPSHVANNINDYKLLVQSKLSSFIKEDIFIDRFGIQFKPWENWNTDKNPEWWKSYNNVKHKRNLHFEEANLKNTINAVGALLITIIYYYKTAFSQEAKREISFKDTTLQLKPSSDFMDLNSDYYNHSYISN